MGVSVILACALFVGSAALTAVNVTACVEIIPVGAVYSPLRTVPSGGDTDQFTRVLLVPVIDAVNWLD